MAVARHGLMTLLPAAAAALLCTVALTACHNDDGAAEVEEIDGNVTPTMSTFGVDTHISDSGYTRYHLTAAEWLMYEEADDPNWKFPAGLYLETYDKEMNPDAKLRSDSATYFSQRKLWRLDGNVRMRNTDGDRFLTEQLFWDQNQRKVYSDSFIHIERADRTIEGYGFESNENMTTYTVRRPTGIFPVSDFRNTDIDSVTGEETDTMPAQQPRRREPQPRIMARNQQTANP